MTDQRPEEFYRGWLSRVPEYLGAVAAALVLVITWQGSQSLPQRVPVHFNLAGQPDRWGSKNEFYLIALVALLAYGGFWLGQWLVQKTSRATLTARQQLTLRQVVILVGMLRWLKFETTALFTFAVWSIIQVGTGAAAGMSPAVPLGLTGLILGTTAFFIVWLVREKFPDG